MFALIDNKKQDKEILMKNKEGKNNDKHVENTKTGKTNDTCHVNENELKLKEIEEELKQNKFLCENFEIQSLIGSGSESEVYRMIFKKYRKEFALKKVLKNKIKTQNKNEMIIASKMKQKNIINFYAYYALDNNNSELIIMENAKFGNLRNFQIKTIKRSYLSESFLCYFAIQILNGLVYMHRCKIAHMDIKPQNIAIDEYLNAKIIDFSISINYQGKRPSDELRLPFAGTNFYMPLEVLDEKKIKYKDLNKVDAYALGVLLYNLAFGYYPFNLTNDDSKDYQKISQKIQKDLKFDKEKDLSSPFIDFMSKLLEKDINKRMSIYEALEHHWIKGAELLMMEKENLFNVNSFVIRLMTDEIKSFNDYMKQ